MDDSKCLRGGGIRMTKQKKWILEGLCHHPQSAEELFIKLKKAGHRLDITTIYRNLEMLTRGNSVSMTRFADGVARYELRQGSKHHHHAVCDDCGKIIDLELDEDVLMRQVFRQTNFHVERHMLEFFGKCSNCK